MNQLNYEVLFKILEKEFEKLNDNIRAIESISEKNLVEFEIID